MQNSVQGGKWLGHGEGILHFFLLFLGKNPHEEGEISKLLRETSSFFSMFWPKLTLYY